MGVTFDVVQVWAAVGVRSAAAGAASSRRPLRLAFAERCRSEPWCAGRQGTGSALREWAEKPADVGRRRQQPARQAAYQPRAGTPMSCSPQTAYPSLVALHADSSDEVNGVRTAYVPEEDSSRRRGVPSNKRMQLTRRGPLVGVARFARQSLLSRASQLIRGVGPTLDTLAAIPSDGAARDRLSDLRVA